MSRLLLVLLLLLCCLRLAHELRRQGLRVDVYPDSDKLGKQFKYAVSLGVPFVVVLGEDEKAAGEVSVKDLLTILETLGNVGYQVKDPDYLTEFVRQALARSITQQFKPPDNRIYVVSLEKSLEDMIEQAIQRTEMGNYLALDPNVAKMVIQRISDGVRKCVESGCEPIVLTAPAVRPYIKKLTERSNPELVVLSYQEVTPNVKIHSLGNVGLSYAN